MAARVGFVAVAGAVVLALLCGSGDAFVAGAGGVAASGRTARAATSVSVLLRCLP